MKKDVLRFLGIITLCLFMALTIFPNNAWGASAPPVPANLTASSPNSSTIDISWDASDGASSYYVYRSLSASANYEKVATVKEATYTSTDLCANTTYYFKVRAYSSNGTSNYSAAASAKTLAPSIVPETPAGLRAAANNSQEISLTWNATPDAEYYYLYRDTSSSGSFSTKIASVKDTSYTNTGLTAGKRYYYKVAAYNSLGTSAKSSYVSAKTYIDTPDIPENLTAAAVSSSQINLSWDSASGATSYYVFRSSASTGTYTKIATVTDEYYSNTGLSANTTYYYKVQAHNSAGTSDYSSRVYATTKSTSATGDAANCYRLAGSDRYATSAKIAEDGWESSDYAVIASGENFPDALCGAPLAAKYNAPILLTAKDQLNDKTRIQLLDLDVKQVFIIVGVNVISASVEQAIRNLGMSVTRIAGTNRYDTSLKVAQQIGTFDKVIIATGNNFPDALSIASIAGSKGYPIILADRDSIQTDILSYIKSKVSATIVIGGTGVISDSVFNKLPSPARLKGDNRYLTNLNIIKYYADGLDFKFVMLQQVKISLMP